MKNTAKQLFAIILGLVMLVTMAVPALADDDPAEIVASGKAGEKIDWTLDADGVLRLEGEGEMYSYENNSQSPWYGYHSAITSAVIGDGITTVGGLMFEDCRNMTSVSIPDSVTTIEAYAFGWCSSLARVTVPESVTEIGEYAFVMCNNAVFFTGDAPVLSETSLFGIYAAIYLSDRDGWTEELFDFLSSGIRWFTYNTEDSVIASGDIGENLTWTLTYDGLLTVSGKGEMIFTGEFANAPWHSIRQLIVTAVIEDGVTSIGASAFDNCCNMTDVSIPDSVTDIEPLAFYWCSSLKTINIPKNVEYIGNYAFYGCESLTAITVDGRNQWFAADEYGVLYTSDYGVLIQAPTKLAGEYEIRDGAFIIYEDAFYGCENLTGVVIPQSVSRIYNGAFSLTGIETLTLPSDVEYIGSCTFSRCANLHVITFLGSAPDIIGDAFEGVTANVYFPEDDPTWTEDMFRSYGGLLTWPAYSDEPVDTTYRAWFNADGYIAGAPGDIVSIKVNIAENEGIASGSVKIRPWCFTILDIQPGDWTDKGRYSMNYETGEVVWTSTEECTGEGLFVEYIIQINEDVQPQSYYYVEFTAENLTGIQTDENGQPVAVKYDHGKYKVAQEYYIHMYIRDNSVSTVPGDFNNDWYVDNIDIVILARWLVNLVEPDSDYDKMVLRNGDFNGSGSIDNADLVALARYRVEN